jgi:hypothetical protein
MQLSSMAKKVSETNSFVSIASKMVSESKGMYYQIKNFINDSGIYKYTVEVLDQNNKTLKVFQINTFLGGKNSSKVYFELVK